LGVKTHAKNWKTPFIGYLVQAGPRKVGVVTMPLLPVNIFRKFAHCPASEILLEYRRNSLTPTQTAWVEAHLSYCDFCDAELHLLGCYRDEAEIVLPGEIPAGLRELAELLLPQVMRPRPLLHVTHRPRAVS